MNSTLSKVLAILFLVVVAVYPAYQFLAPFFTSDGKTVPVVVEKFTPDLKTHLTGRFVAVANNGKDGEVTGWYFAPTDQIKVTQLDLQVEGRKKIVYAEIWVLSDDKYMMSGILEAHYLKIADVHYLIALGSVNLTIESPPGVKEKDLPKPKKELPKNDKPSTGIAQPLPGDKR